jgi:hypothetical protein
MVKLLIVTIKAKGKRDEETRGSEADVDDR